MRKQLQVSDAAYRGLKTNREENLTKYARSMDAYVKKAEKLGKSNNEKGGEQAETRVEESEVKYLTPTPTVPKFPTPTP